MPRFMYGLVFALAASTAHAGTTDLFCHESGTNRTDGLNVSIDTGAKTATVWTSGFARGDSSPIPATITADQVSWSAESSIGTTHYTLDRETGILTELYPNQTGGIVPVTDVWSCKKDTPVL
jgi:hypothetical protein